MNRSDLSSVATRYILGQLPPEERARLEEEYFANSELFEELVAAENDLIDAYVAGRLHGNDLAQFESHFLNTPEHQERVAFARTLLQSKSRNELPDPPPIKASSAQRTLSLFSARGVAAALIFLVVAGGLWLAIWDGLRYGREIRQLRNSQAQLEGTRQELQQKIAQLESELARQTSPTPDHPPLAPSGQAAVVLTLSADLVRGHTKPNVLPLSSSIASALLMLETGRGTYTDYESSLETPGGTALLTKKGLESWKSKEGTVVIVPLPAFALPHGDYVIRLIGIDANHRAQELDAYSFRVVTR